MDVKTIGDLWPVFGALIALVVWAVRLEGRISGCEKDIAAVDKRVTELADKHESLDSKVMEKLAEVREILARIEGHLGVVPKA